MGTKEGRRAVWAAATVCAHFLSLARERRGLAGGPGGHPPIGSHRACCLHPRSLGNPTSACGPTGPSIRPS